MRQRPEIIPEPKPLKHCVEAHAANQPAECYSQREKNEDLYQMHQERAQEEEIVLLLLRTTARDQTSGAEKL